MKKTTPKQKERFDYRKISNLIAAGLLVIGAMQKDQKLLCKTLANSCTENMDKITSYILIIVISLFIVNLLQKILKISATHLTLALQAKNPKGKEAVSLTVKIQEYLLVFPIILLAVLGITYFQEIHNQVIYIMAIMLTVRSFRIKFA